MKRLSYCLAAIALGLFLAFGQQRGDEGSGSTSNSTATSEQAQRVRVAEGISNGLLAKKVNPRYPDEARKAHIQGQVVLKALIDKDGNVENLTVVSGDPALAPAALEAVKQWKYRPYLLNYKPQNVETIVRVNFQLRY